MKEHLERRLAPFGQQHLLAFWDQLTDVERQRLAEQIDRVDFAALAELVKKRA